MNYIVLDLEWNQSSDDEESNQDLRFEIVEIGAIKLNEDKEPIAKFQELIKPAVYTKFHYVTQKLIHITMEDLQNRRCFVDVMNDFISFCGEDYVFCTWGTQDLYELQKNMDFYNMNPLSNGPIAFLDIQKLFSIAFEDGKSRRSLEYAVDILQIEKDIPFHRAYADTYYTVKVMNQIMKEEIFSYYSYDVFHLPKGKKNEIRVEFPTYYKYISRGFQSKTEAFNDREILSMKCYKCKKLTHRRVKWFSLNGKHYYAVSKCDKHGLIKAKVRVRKDRLDKIYIVKTMRPISLEEMNLIKDKYEKWKNAKNV